MTARPFPFEWGSDVACSWCGSLVPRANCLGLELFEVEPPQQLEGTRGDHLSRWKVGLCSECRMRVEELRDIIRAGGAPF